MLSEGFVCNGTQLMRNDRYPSRIVCLTEETTEILYRLGEQDRIVGISGFTVRPPQARREKPRVCAFTSAKFHKILDLKPDLVIGFSDLQADIAATLIREGISTLVMNHRSVNEILDLVTLLSGMVGAAERGEELVAELQGNIDAARRRALALTARPRVYFEEWDEPMISAIQWVSELIGIAGGEDCFADLGRMPHGKDRIIADASRIIEADPEVIIGSWCGKKFRPERVASRPGWSAISAVQQARLHEIKSARILQPGPAALSDGLDDLVAIIHGCT